ncbi:MAG: Hsp70 family protein [Candidatus Anaerobiospirillum pullicola]|uniref:Hsp70 family protein n=1 Tax=Candidatus Anaerobiospirillum pullicola TaxID=2838451 RepID=A0A948WYS1_9GAMM|nr:Hsp70 family protein [Candidatus Anaerobiospirillum pullicola]
MSRIKFDYGIDLGTTNSSIARMENGAAVIQKTKNLMDTMPSCVYFAQNRKGEKSIRVGSKAKDSRASDALKALNDGSDYEEFGYIEFKREMGSDKHYSNAHMPKAFYTPEELSAEVLKELKSFVNDEQVSAVVITVPAMFTATQKEATMKAAQLAGFRQCELLQEPIAACMAYGLSVNQKDGRWLVFDFGGGTFDAALVKVEDGILTVHDTEGDNYLGGKNLDEDVINKILLPYLHYQYNLESLDYDEVKAHNINEVLKGIAEEIRVELSFTDSYDYSSYDRSMSLGEDDDGEEMEIDLTVTNDELREAIAPHYQKAIDICKNLLARNHLSGDQLSSLILVGGPTYSPMLRDMLREQLTPNVDTNTNPMTAVATGAALYASTLDVAADNILEKAHEQKDAVFLNVSYESTSVGTSEWVAVSLDPQKSAAGTPKEVSIVVERADGIWTSDKITVNDKGNVVEVSLKDGVPNFFKIKAYDALGNSVNVQPNEFTIIQGIKVSSAPLPYNIGISIYDPVKECGVFKPVKGLEKNKPLPATGILGDRRTTQVLCPGRASDILLIPVYQAPLDAEGFSTDFHTKIGAVSITGDEVDRDIAADSPVDITIKVDKSEMMSLEVFFPNQDLTIKKELSLSGRQSQDDAVQRTMQLISRAEDMLDKLKDAKVDARDLEAQLHGIQEQIESSADAMRDLSNIKTLLFKIEKRTEQNQFKMIKDRLDSILTEIIKQLGESPAPEHKRALDDLLQGRDIAERDHDVTTMRLLFDKALGLFSDLNQDKQALAALAFLIRDYDLSTCTDVDRAKALIMEAMLMICEKHPAKDDAMVDRARHIFIELIDLNPAVKERMMSSTETGGLLK